MSDLAPLWCVIDALLILVGALACWRLWRLESAIRDLHLTWVQLLSYLNRSER